MALALDNILWIIKCASDVRLSFEVFLKSFEDYPYFQQHIFGSRLFFPNVSNELSHFFKF